MCGDQPNHRLKSNKIELSEHESHDLAGLRHPYKVIVEPISVVATRDAFVAWLSKAQEKNENYFRHVKKQPGLADM